METNDLGGADNITPDPDILRNVEALEKLYADNKDAARRLYDDAQIGQRFRMLGFERTLVGKEWRDYGGLRYEVALFDNLESPLVLGWDDFWYFTTQCPD